MMDYAKIEHAVQAYGPKASAFDRMRLNLFSALWGIMARTEARAKDGVRPMDDVADELRADLAQGIPFMANHPIPVDGESLITADRGIAAAATKNGLSVLLISEGHVALDGFPYGFIGGAAFKIANDCIAFTGNLNEHPDRGRIVEFLRKCGIRPLYLTDHSAFDIGSAIALWESSV